MTREPIETGRLLIRSTRDADVPACLELWMRPEEGRYLADPTRESADERYLNWGKDVEQEEGWYPLVVCLRESGDFIGTCSYVPSEDSACWDLGYVLSRAYWRQGYGTEMLQALIAEGKRHGVRRFTADVAKENAASCGLLRSLGFRILKDDECFRKRGTDIVYPQYTFYLDI